MKFPVPNGPVVGTCNTPSVRVKFGRLRYPGPIGRRRKFGWWKGSNKEVAATEGKVLLLDVESLDDVNTR
jgi:hypothetical protein